jgi:hypothetical protein
MTPITLVSFVFSLAFVEMRYELLRSHTHAEASNSRLPGWLHHLLYRSSPYAYVRVRPGDAAHGASATPVAADAVHATRAARPDEDAHWYYHNHQKKLMRMEAEEAFRIRHTVVVVLALVAALASWGGWLFVGVAWRTLRGWMAAPGL